MEDPKNLETRAQILKGLPTLSAAAQADGLPAGFYKPRVASSRIKGIAWGYPATNVDFLAKLTPEKADAEPRVAPLVVIFASGAPWAYDGVPAFKVLGLLDAPSAGKYFGGEILNNPAYKPTKLPNPKEANASPAGMLPPAAAQGSDGINRDPTRGGAGPSIEIKP